MDFTDGLHRDVIHAFLRFTSNRVVVTSVVCTGDQPIPDTDSSASAASIDPAIAAMH